MSVCDRPFLRLFVHCRDRKFVQLALPSDSLCDLTRAIQTKFSKLYTGGQIRTPRLQCVDGFDLDFDDIVADIFEDRDHVFIDLSDGDEILSPAKKTRFRSPAPSLAAGTPQMTTTPWRSGGSPIQHKITPVSSLPNVTETPKVVVDDESSDDSTENKPLLAPVKKPTSKKPAPKPVAASRPESVPEANDAVKDAAQEPIKAARGRKPASKPKTAIAPKAVVELKEPSSSPQPKQAGMKPEQSTTLPMESAAGVNESVTQPKKQKKPKKDSRPKEKSADESGPKPDRKDVAGNGRVETDEVAEAQSETIAGTADVTHDNNVSKPGRASTNDDMATCKKCQLSVRRSSMGTHRKLHYEFACSQCSKRFGSEKGLEGHIKKTH